LTESALRAGETLEHVHFPATRVPLEAVIRLLIEQFHVRPVTPRSVWRKVFAHTERDFIDVAHRAISGPNRVLKNRVQPRFSISGPSTPCVKDGFWGCPECVDTRVRRPQVHDDVARIH
jgi:hypothetical protein